MFIDEFSRITEDREVLGSTADTTGARVFNFTHMGLDTAACELSQRPDVRKLVLHWSQHPDKRPGLYQVTAGVVEKLDPAYQYPADYPFVTDGSPTGGPFPRLRSPWYDEECRRRQSPRDVAMHLDINPQGAMAQFFNALVIRQLQEQHAAAPLWEGDVAFTANGDSVHHERFEG